jgi:hypothetical protein
MTLQKDGTPTIVIGHHHENDIAKGWHYNNWDNEENDIATGWHYNNWDNEEGQVTPSRQ